MDKLKNMHIGISPITGRIYMGEVDPKNPEEWKGEKVDITDEFVGVLLEKFPPQTTSIIVKSGKAKYTIRVERLKNGDGNEEQIERP